MADSEVFFPSKYAGRHNDRGTLPAAASTKYPKGTLVARDANGRAARPADGLAIHGISNGENDNTATGPNGDGGNDAFLVEMDIGLGEFDYSGTAPKPDQVVYAVDNHTVSLDSNGGARGIAGVCTEQGANGKVVIYVDPVVNGALKSGVGLVQSVSLTLGFASLTDADGSQSFNVGAVLPAGAVVIGHAVNVTQAFTDGAAGDFDLDIGVAGTLTSIVNDMDLSPTGKKYGPLGARAGGRYDGEQILATVRANVNLNTSTAGSAVIEVFYVVK